MHNNQIDHIDDTTLLNRYYADGNKEWLGILLQRYTLLLLGVCMKYLKNEEEAKDAVQQIFLKSLNELDKYPVTYFKSWLYKVACNYCLMKLRSEQKNVLLTEHQDYPEIPAEPAGQMIEKEITLQMLESAITALNEEQKTCITLFYLRKKSYQEIATLTGFTQLQVKSHLQNGKRNLKIIMEKKHVL